MCYEVSCHRFLYDYFQEHQEDTRVTIRKINIVRRNVEQELKLKLRIDITRDSLSAVVNNTNGCLVLENRHIQFLPDFLTNFSIESSDELPDDILQHYKEILKKKIF